jgi:hypothetical protein
LSPSPAPLIVTPSDAEVSQGDLHATISGNQILIPRAAAQSFDQQGVRTAADLLSFMQTYPSAVAKALNWSDKDVSAATEKLRGQLAGKVDSALLSDPKDNPPLPPLGARDPAELPDSSKR